MHRTHSDYSKDAETIRKEVYYRGFKITRTEPPYHLWRISDQCGKPVTGLDSLFTNFRTAERKIDTFLARKEIARHEEQSH